MYEWYQIQICKKNIVKHTHVKSWDILGYVKPIVCFKANIGGRNIQLEIQ